MNVIAKTAAPPTPATIEDVLIRGDLSKLTDAQRNEYYMRVCQSVGLNPLTRPFDYLTLSGKLVLYAKRDAADQLRKLNGISIKIVGQEQADGLLIVHAQATDKSGRSDEDFGAVPFKISGGEIGANAFMKAVTKAKRRVTLSISGLGFLDETEVGAWASESSDDEPPAAKKTDEPPAEKKISADMDWRKYAEDLIETLRACDSKVEMFELLEQRKDDLAEMAKAVPMMFKNLNAKIESLRDEPS